MLYFHVQTRRRSMKSILLRLRLGAVICILTMMLPAISISTFTQVASAAGGGFTRQIASAGTSSFASTPDGTTDPAWPEFAGATNNNPGPAPYNGSIFNRSQSQSASHGASTNTGKKSKPNPKLK